MSDSRCRATPRSLPTDRSTHRLGRAPDDGSGAVVGPAPVLDRRGSRPRLHLSTPLRRIFADDRLGTLEPGRLADVVVLDRDLFVAQDEELAGVGVDLTVVSGEVAYDSARLTATSDSIS